MRSSNNKNTLFNSQDDDLTDFFINMDRYTQKDIESLKIKYSEKTNPLATIIFNLLSALEQFYFATTIETSFKRYRDNAAKATIDDSFKKNLTNAFSKMQAALEVYINTTASTRGTDAEIVKHAGQFVMSAICARITALEQINDPLIISYQDNLSDLKHFISKNKTINQKI